VAVIGHDISDSKALEVERQQRLIEEERWREGCQRRARILRANLIATACQPFPRAGAPSARKPRAFSARRGPFRPQIWQWIRLFFFPIFTTASP
jgi:hypothetical protein